MDVIQYHFNEDWEEVYTDLQESYCVNLEGRNNINTISG